MLTWFIKLCNNIIYYITLEPILGEPRSDTLFSIENNSKWYKHHVIKNPYPVIFWGDIEIHYIHEQENQSCLDKFIRRLNRMIYIIETKPYKIISVLSFSELINNHEDIQSIIDSYLINPINIFCGPSQYRKNDNYIIMREWDNIKLERDESHIYTFNNQKVLVDIFANHIIANYK